MGFIQTVKDQKSGLPIWLCASPPKNANVSTVTRLCTLPTTLSYLPDSGHRQRSHQNGVEEPQALGDGLRSVVDGHVQRTQVKIPKGLHTLMSLTPFPLLFPVRVLICWPGRAKLLIFFKLSYLSLPFPAIYLHLLFQESLTSFPEESLEYTIDVHTADPLQFISSPKLLVCSTITLLVTMERISLPSVSSSSSCRQQ